MVFILSMIQNITMPYTISKDRIGYYHFSRQQCTKGSPASCLVMSYKGGH